MGLRERPLGPRERPQVERTQYNDGISRFNLDLDGAENYEFNWLDLIAAEEDSKAKDGGKKPHYAGAAQTMSGVLDPYASDDEDQLKALARKYEQKYGGGESASDKVKKKKKARKLDDYADLGYGYDSNDPFIDNSDVHDEIVPENVTT